MTSLTLLRLCYYVSNIIQFLSLFPYPIIKLQIWCNVKQVEVYFAYCL